MAGQNAYRVLLAATGGRFYEGYDRFGNRLTLDGNGNGNLDAEIGCTWKRAGAEVWIKTGAWGEATRITW